VHASIEGAELYALSCELVRASGPATIERIDPWSGKVRWRATLPRRIRVLGPPLCTPEAILVVSADEGNRTGVIAYDRQSGEPRYDLSAGLCGGTAATIVVDDTLIANSDSGELVGIDCATGAIRYRHVFGGDQPHGLTPVLRSGALFVPQSEVFVVRPSDGSVLARVPSDLVPDAIRVDERCGVYIAESSGYLGAYRALPTLSLVKA
jgi:outer membrane protein assembly factor BamB